MDTYEIDVELTDPESNAPPDRDTLRTLSVAPAAQSALDTNPVGRVIQGRYEIKRLVGKGGMGSVFEAEHLDLGRRVAVKLVDSSLARDPQVATRIKQEARSAGAIESEHIVQVFDAGDDADLGVFLVMELLKGEDLSALLARERALSPIVAAGLIAQAAQGLARAHSAGIVHRDLKPGNIFVCTRENGGSLVKLVDFGIAKLLRDASRQGAKGLTQVGMVVGTPQYMSPEQAQGLDLDHRTDIYSLGAVLFEAIVGTSPYPELPTYEQTILQIMLTPCPRISEFVPSVHPGLDQLCADMMAPTPAGRPQEMIEVRDRLIAILEDLGAAPPRSQSVSDDIGFAATVTPAPSVGMIPLSLAHLRMREDVEGSGKHVVELPVHAARAPRRRTVHAVVSSVLASAAVMAIGFFGMSVRGASPAPPVAARFGGVQTVVVATNTIGDAPADSVPLLAQPPATEVRAPIPTVTVDSLPVVKKKPAMHHSAPPMPSSAQSSKDAAPRLVGSMGESEEF
ncbi:MAG: serine/threonine-protein kinase [Polyangiaceae bacterium]